MPARVGLALANAGQGEFRSFQAANLRCRTARCVAGFTAARWVRIVTDSCTMLLVIGRMTRDWLLNQTWRRFGAFFTLVTARTGFGLMTEALRGNAVDKAGAGTRLPEPAERRPFGTMRDAVKAIWLAKGRAAAG